MLATKIFLALVGLAYFALSAWCVLLPERTSHSVGFSLKPGSGQSEYFVIYGGLQLAIAILFIGPTLQLTDTKSALLFCLVIHACIVLFRAISFATYSGISTTTYVLAVVEWVIFLASLGFWILNKNETSGP